MARLRSAATTLTNCPHGRAWLLTEVGTAAQRGMVSQPRSSGHSCVVTDDLPVRIVGGRVVTTPPNLQVARVWLPLDGKVVAAFPPWKGNRRWLHESVAIRSPDYGDENGKWTLPRSSLVRLVIGAIERFGYVVVWRDMARLSRCTRVCLEATGIDCQCQCMGAHHGQDADGWFERIGDAVVADCGDYVRSAVVYGARGSDCQAEIYNGELSEEVYTVDFRGRREWPKAAQFMCASCVTARAMCGITAILTAL